MTRARLRKAALKAQAATRARTLTEADHIAEGVREVAVHLTPVVTRGALYWAAPFRYVIEQMAPRVCRVKGLPVERAEDVGEYLLAAFNEFVVSLVESFDVEHFEAWSVAQKRQEEAASG